MVRDITSIWTTDPMLQTLTWVCIISGIGLLIDKFFAGRGFSLGAATVFFVGILAAHAGVQLQSDLLAFFQDFGLIIFIYSLGLQVGPSFVSSLKTNGFYFNLWAITVILLGSIGALIICYSQGMGIGTAIGILSGSVTNTPALGAAQQAASTALGLPVTAPPLNEMALACAVCYPMGVVGVILVLDLLKRLFPAKVRSSAVQKPDTFVAEYDVLNEGVVGKTLAEVHNTTSVDYVITRLWRSGKVYPVSSDTKFELHDRLIVVSSEADVDRIKEIFGSEAHESDAAKGEPTGSWATDDNRADRLVSRRILLTKAEANGVTLASLRARNEYGVNVTRVTRAEIEILPKPNLHLQLGDRLTVVGHEEDIERFGSRIGNSLKALDTPYLISIFVGIFLGCVLGSIPIALPGLSNPIKLGIAGGPIIVGILIGAYGPRFRITTYITHSANLMLRTLGITIYLAGLGLSSGSGFFETLLRGNGGIWFAWGILLTILPIFLVGVLLLSFSKMSFSTVSGILCGSMANPIALDHINRDCEDSSATASYATVYPFGMFLRILLAQLLVSILLS